MLRTTNTIDNRIAKDKESLLIQLEKLPIVQVACEKVSVGRATYYRWRKEDPDFMRRSDMAIDTGVSLINDMTESQLLTKIKNGHFPAMVFWLKHRHKSYSTKLELSGNVTTSSVLTEEQKGLLDKAINFAFSSDEEALK